MTNESCLDFVQQLRIYPHASRGYYPGLQISFTVQGSCLQIMLDYQHLKCMNKQKIPKDEHHDISPQYKYQRSHYVEFLRRVGPLVLQVRSKFLQETKV